MTDCHIQRVAAVIKDAAEHTPYWVADDPSTHQDPWDNAALALEAQGLLAAPPAPPKPAPTFTGPGYEAHPGHDHEDCCK
jgi:hypothetical protein